MLHASAAGTAGIDVENKLVVLVRRAAHELRFVADDFCKAFFEFALVVVFAVDGDGDWRVNSLKRKTCTDRQTRWAHQPMRHRYSASCDIQ